MSPPIPNQQTPPGLSLAQWQTLLATLQTNYALGVLEITFEGRRQIFVSGKDMLDRIAYITGQIALLSGVSNTTYASSSRCSQDDGPYNVPGNPWDSNEGVNQ